MILEHIGLSQINGSLVVLDGVKGAGIREVEETVANHSMNVSPETCDRWLSGLRAELQALEGGEGA